MSGGTLIRYCAGAGEKIPGSGDGLMKTICFFLRRTALVIGIAVSALPGHAEEVHVAVAANFTAAMQEIALAFEKDSGHKVQLVFGSTGKLYAQIKNGAPFDVLLSADDTTPARLENEHEAVTGSRFTYATGQLVLWSATKNRVDDKGEVLKNGSFKHLAIGNPETVPYGVAAIQTLKALGLLDAIQTKLVQGENITQTWQFVATGNAELGFVALSQVIAPDKHGQGTIRNGSAWLVPPGFYAPLHQDMVLLNRAKNNAAAKALLQYLKSKTAQDIIKAYGYDVAIGE